MSDTRQPLLLHTLGGDPLRVMPSVITAVVARKHTFGADVLVDGTWFPVQESPDDVTRMLGWPADRTDEDCWVTGVAKTWREMTQAERDAIDRRIVGGVK